MKNCQIRWAEVFIGLQICILWYDSNSWSYMSLCWLFISPAAVWVHTHHTTCIKAKAAVRQMHPPDVVVAELGILGPVEQHRPRRGVYGIRLGSGPGHLIICLAVTGGGASRSCTVGLMGERRGWVSVSERQRDTERERERQRETEREEERERERGRERDTHRHRLETWFTVQKRRRPISTRGYCLLMYAEAGGVDSMTFPVINSPPCPSVLLCRYRQCTHARFATPTGPPAYNGCAERCTMANKHTGSVCFISTSTCSYVTQRRPGARQIQIIILLKRKKKWQKRMQHASSADSLPPRHPGFVISNHFTASWSPLSHPRMSSRTRAFFILECAQSRDSKV